MSVVDPKIMNFEFTSQRDFLYDAHKIDSNIRVFFTSDFHHSHDREFIWGVRGHKNVEEMNEKQTKNWNSVITNDDYVFHLGDLKFGKEITYEEVLRRLNFKRIYLMSGNHFSGYQDIVQKMVGHCGYLLDGYKEVQPIPNYFELWYRKQFIVLSHYPIGSWNKIRKGSIQLFGHCHGTYKNISGKQMDVGFDNFPVPLEFTQIQQIMNKQKIVQVDGHHTNLFFEKE